jgi:hypothetical protein
VAKAMKFECDESTLIYRVNRPTTGAIWLSFNQGSAFPYQNWFDYPKILLEYFLSQCDNLLDRRFEIYFFDGPAVVCFEPDGAVTCKRYEEVLFQLTLSVHSAGELIESARSCLAKVLDFELRNAPSMN